MNDNTPADWDCDAYGPDGREVRAFCFFAGEPGTRVCGSPGACRDAMDAERRRVFRRIQDLAAQGDGTAIYLAGEFTSPGQILGGQEARPADGD